MSFWISQIDIHDPLERYCTMKNNEVLDYDVNINEKSSPFEDLYYATLNSMKYLFISWTRCVQWWIKSFLIKFSTFINKYFLILLLHLMVLKKMLPLCMKTIFNLLMRMILRKSMLMEKIIFILLSVSLRLNSLSGRLLKNFMLELIIVKILLQERILP